MVQSATVGPLDYRSGQQMQSHQRVFAMATVVGLHIAVIGVFYIAQLRAPTTPPERTLSVSFISEAPSNPAPTPPQPPAPTPPPPKTQMLSTTSPTPSPMTAPPMEKDPPRETRVQQPVPATPQPPAAAASSAQATAAATTPPNFTAAYLNNPGPTYPMASRRRHDEGVVRLRVQVSAEGAPTQVLLDRSSGSADLDAAAVDIVKKRWRFAPAKQGDRPVSAWVVVPMEFSLKNR